ncbi:hypothetical protein DFH09DRAFT_1072433 [Mycena vulgaris]|nr:hypothetical protein DFH09DRAFT_1072433 [Mycena vulgaris]
MPGTLLLSGLPGDLRAARPAALVQHPSHARIRAHGVREVNAESGAPTVALPPADLLRRLCVLKRWLVGAACFAARGRLRGAWRNSASHLYDSAAGSALYWRSVPLVACPAIFALLRCPPCTLRRRLALTTAPLCPCPRRITHARLSSAWPSSVLRHLLIRADECSQLTRLGAGRIHSVQGQERLSIQRNPTAGVRDSLRASSTLPNLVPARRSACARFWPTAVPRSACRDRCAARMTD